MTIITGDRELDLRFQRLPAAVHARLENRMSTLVDELKARAQSAAPRRTGRLQGEIVGRVYADSPTRVAGYVQVYAPGAPNEYPKAATLEYGSNKPRRIVERAQSGILARLRRSRQRLLARTSSPVHIRAYRYLRGSIEGMRSEIASGLADAVTEAVNEEDST
jgi:hypothetical protein